MLTAAGMAPVIGAQGLGHLPAGPLPDVLFAEVARRTGADPAGAPTPGSVAEFFAGTRIDLTADEALAAAEDFGPDLVVAELCDFVGPLVAAAAGVPVATLAFGPPLPPVFTDTMEAMARTWHEARALPWEPRKWLLDTWPSSMRADGWQQPEGWLALRPEAFREPGAVPATSPVSGRPRVLVTFGTWFGEPAKLSPLLRSLSALDADVVVTLGLAAKPEDFDVDHERITFVGFTPMEDLLDGVDVVVTHGGAGTTSAALLKGVPLVVLPQGADQFFQAERVAAARVGVALDPASQTPEGVVAAVRTVLGDGSIRENVTTVAKEISAMPDAPEVAATLEAGP
ncbi:nucleotide disphospho-sugar-binding domain-containing protein [Lentzea sp. DG1S-22]|uniref:glycosyltransferase n=1 Tax=Lentzea sp. DG1S-22 TaxID=3108822 RepID=UPI002E7AAE32|nr:nucleotide disphospho-sugar-binding domain-containing protein [Lentzea sp. DG1S-22]WVH79961.1 nucleotide disphospho-sugar-binding domain-containing protein [Lentzea sp. DG1S-22]